MKRRRWWTRTRIWVIIRVRSNRMYIMKRRNVVFRTFRGRSKNYRSFVICSFIVFFSFRTTVVTIFTLIVFTIYVINPILCQWFQKCQNGRGRSTFTRTGELYNQSASNNTNNRPHSRGKLHSSPNTWRKGERRRETRVPTTPKRRRRCVRRLAYAIWPRRQKEENQSDTCLLIFSP